MHKWYFLKDESDGIADKEGCNDTYDGHQDGLRDETVYAVEDMREYPNVNQVYAESAFGAVLDESGQFACGVKRMTDAEYQKCRGGDKDVGGGEFVKVGFLVLGQQSHGNCEYETYQA